MSTFLESGNINDNAIVMIVDDDASTRMMANEFLSQAGFSVVEAEDGIEALKRIPEARPDMIILDVEMPRMNGFDTCIELRKLDSTASVPVLMLTGLDNSEAIDLAYQAGATDFATKPINWSLLCYRVRYMLRASQASERLIKSQKSLIASQRIAQLGNWEQDLQQGKVQWSEQLFEILDYNSAEIEPSHEALLSKVHAEDRSRVQAWMSQTEFNDRASIDHRLVLSENNVRSVRQQMECARSSDGTVMQLQAVVQDFTERRQAEEKIHQLAYYDSLTSLPNRALFREELEERLLIAKQQEQSLAILYLDLDDFSRINDTLGHATGDLLLREVAQRLNNHLRTEKLELSGLTNDPQSDNQEALVARMGGDEFVILLSGISEVADVVSVADRILSVLSQPYTVARHDLFTTPSIGISMYPGDGESADDLLRNADMAMYGAKRDGKNLYKVHDEAMEELAQRRYKIDTSLRSVLDKDELIVFYQPQTDLNTGKISAVEALIRWHSSELGFVSPADFIPVAEENGLIIPIGEWVLRTACTQAKSWSDQGFPINKVAVNISVLQFGRSDFLSLIEQILEETGLPAEQLELEITESLLAKDIDRAVITLRKLKNIGVELSIDDFGTGYSSLSQLRNFPIDRLKIDQSFISRVTDSKEDAAITRAVIAMSESMQIKVLAEGVETREQLDFLREQGCDEVQGYLVSKPLPANEIEENMAAMNEQLLELFANDVPGSLKTGTG